MNETLSRIRLVLDGLARRRLRLLLGEAVARTLGAVFLVLAGLLIGASAGLVPLGAGPAALVLLGMAAVGAAAWDARSWRRAGDLRLHAERIEGVAPQLRGSLLTVLDRTARPLGSATLLERMAGQVAEVVATVPPQRAWGDEGLRRGAARAGIALMILLLASVVQSPLDLLRLLFIGEVATAPVAPPPGAEVPKEMLGDITLRYLYPTYTRMEPLEVPNSNGEAHAPPGTVVEIRARTATTHETAVLRAYDRADAAQVVEGRQVSGSFTVSGPGLWRFEFGDVLSADMKIVPEPDLAPDVAIQAPGPRVPMAIDAELPVPYTVRDDYGVARVVVEGRTGKERREVEVRAPADMPRVLGDALRLSPKALGLRAGQRATLRLGAWDNDEVSGSKAGWSAPVELEVLGPRGSEERLWAFRQAARDALVLVLADFLLDPIPPAESGTASAAWGAVAEARYATFDQLVRDTWLGSRPPKLDTTLIGEVQGSRRTLVAFARGLAAEELPDRDLATLDDLHAKNVATLEQAILLLDTLLRARALADVTRLAEQVAKEAAELEEDFSGLTPSQAAARLDQLDRLFQELAEAASKLDEGQLKEFLNDRGDEMKSLMAEIRKAIAEGRMDDAKQMMERLSALMKSMADDLKEMEQRRQSGDDRLGKAMEALQEELKALEKEQQDLRDRTQKARRQFGSDMDQAVQAWKEVERLADEIANTLANDAGLVEARRYDAGMDAAIGEAGASAEGLRDSARARDLETALERVENVIYGVGRASARRNSLLRLGDGEDAARLKALGGVLAELAKKADRAQELLEQMRGDQSDASPELQQTLRELAEEQQQIAQRSREAADGAEQIAQQLPMKVPGLERGTQQAAQQAERAAGAMRAGDPMRAEGGQRATEDGLREAQEALEDAQDNLRQMQQSGEGQGNGGEGDEQERGQSDKDGEGGSSTTDDMMLPAPEEYQSPEEYRKALLEGMEAMVPQAYEAAKQRYYEELVRQ